MRADAAVAREKAARLLAYAEALEAAADIQEGLRSRNGYDTVARMESTVASQEVKHPGPGANDGPMLKAARAKGYDTLQGFAGALGEPYGVVRTANSRGSISARLQKKIDTLPHKSRAR